MNTTDKAILTIEAMSVTITDLRTQLDAAETERDALKAALAFYADGITVSASKRTFIAPDDGTIARRALDGDV